VSELLRIVVKYSHLALVAQGKKDELIGCFKGLNPAPA
jgi:hypothetical protein